MGYAARKDNVLKCLAALDDVLKRMQAPVEFGVAVEAANVEYAKA